MTKQVPRIFIKSLFGVMTIIVLSTAILLSGVKEKKDFNRLTGKVIYFDQVFEEWPMRNIGKYRYLQVDSYPKTFELFIGKDKFDFKPSFEQLDLIKVGDTLEIYFEEDHEEEQLNRTVKYIDKGGKSYFINVEKNKIGGIGGIAVGILILVGLIILKRTGKIE